MLRQNLCSAHLGTVQATAPRPAPAGAAVLPHGGEKQPASRTAWYREEGAVVFLFLGQAVTCFFWERQAEKWDGYVRQSQHEMRMGCAKAINDDKLYIYIIIYIYI